MSPEKIAFVIILISGIGFYYKIYYQSKLKNKNRKADIDIFFSRYYGITLFLPLNKNKYRPEDSSDVKKANIGLLFFYLGLICVCVMAKIYFNYMKK